MPTTRSNFSRSRSSNKRFFSNRRSTDEHCIFIFECKSGINCPYWHTKKEINLFKKNGGKGVKKYKSKLCNGTCNKDASECNFAHNRREAVCYKCNRLGHFESECKY